MRSIRFKAFGHENIRATHKTTIEITREDRLTTRGDCIVGVRATLALASLPSWAKAAARNPLTEIVLRLIVDDYVQEVRGHGSPGLTYESETCMVVRRSNYTCGRTLMVGADKAALDLDREFVRRLVHPEAVLVCELQYISRS